MILESKVVAAVCEKATVNRGCSSLRIRCVEIDSILVITVEEDYFDSLGGPFGLIVRATIASI